MLPRRKAKKTGPLATFDQAVLPAELRMFGYTQPTLIEKSVAYSGQTTTSNPRAGSDCNSAHVCVIVETCT